MKCEEVMELMQRELDRDLDDLEQARLRQHLAGCPECAELFARLKRLSDELEQLPRVVPPYSLVDAILPQLEQLATDAAGSAGAASKRDGGESPASAPTPSRRPGRAVYFRIAAAAVFGLVIGLWLVNESFFQRAPSSYEAAMPPSAQEEFAPMSAQSGASPDAAEGDVSVTAKKMMNMTGTGTSGSSKPDGPGSEELRSIRDGAESDAQQAARDPVAKLPENAGEATGGSAFGFVGETPAFPEDAAPGAALGGSLEGVPMFGKPLGQGGAPEGAEGEHSIAAGPQEWPSPDGQWIAYVVDGALKVADATGEKVVFQSAAREGTVELVEWEESGDRLRYVWVGPDGIRTAYSVDLAAGQETLGETEP
jgi:hypothetical protein